MIGARLAQLAALKTKPVPVGGETVIVRQPSAIEQIRYRALRDRTEELGELKPGESRKTEDQDPVCALAYLLERCVTTEAGAQVFTAAEAATVAGGNSDIFLPLVTTLLTWDSDRPLVKDESGQEKKDLSQTENGSPSD